MDETRLAEFAAFARGMWGDEKSEAQTFLTHLFQAFGHAGVAEAGPAGVLRRRRPVQTRQMPPHA